MACVSEKFACVKDQHAGSAFRLLFITNSLILLSKKFSVVM
jgi:hypothetical protein